jgi:hypothetical protein
MEAYCSNQQTIFTLNLITILCCRRGKLGVVTFAATVVLILCVGLSASTLTTKHMAFETAGNILLCIRGIRLYCH